MQHPFRKPHNPVDNSEQILDLYYSRGLAFLFMLHRPNSSQSAPPPGADCSSHRFQIGEENG
jgi:hypothetical protein